MLYCFAKCVWIGQLKSGPWYSRAKSKLPNFTTSKPAYRPTYSHSGYWVQRKWAHRVTLSWVALLRLFFIDGRAAPGSTDPEGWLLFDSSIHYDPSFKQNIHSECGSHNNAPPELCRTSYQSQSSICTIAGVKKCLIYDENLAKVFSPLPAGGYNRRWLCSRTGDYVVVLEHSSG